MTENVCNKGLLGNIDTLTKEPSFIVLISYRVIFDQNFRETVCPKKKNGFLPNEIIQMKRKKPSTKQERHKKSAELSGKKQAKPDPTKLEPIEEKRLSTVIQQGFVW